MFQPTVRKLRDKARDVLIAHLTGKTIPKPEEQLEQLLGEAAVLSRAAQMPNPFDQILPNASSSPDTTSAPMFPVVNPNSFGLPVPGAELFGQDPALQWLAPIDATTPPQPTLNHGATAEQPLLQPEARPGLPYGSNTIDLPQNWSIPPIPNTSCSVP